MIRRKWIPLAALCVPLFLEAPVLAQDEGKVAVFGTTVVNPSGLRGEVFMIPKSTKTVPKFEKLTPLGFIYTDSLNIPTREFDTGFPGITDRFEWFAIDYTGRFYIQIPGLYRFSLLSDDGSMLYIDGKTVIDNGGIHPSKTVEGSVDLAGGIHKIRVSYFQGPRSQLALVLNVAGPGQNAYRVFSTNEFKPPVNPEDWKYGNPGDLPTTPDPSAGKKKKGK
jgi:hypothetical protein